jgi:hypothetical protein
VSLVIFMLRIQVMLCRVNQVSLVCKTWQKVEREHPYRPVQLHLRPEDLTSAFMTWHLRDTSMLEEVRVLGYRHHVIVSEDYRKWMLRLLILLSDKAPALRILGLVPPGLNIIASKNEDRHFNLLPLVGALSRLESLALREWEYSVDDIPLITHLTRLQNLKVLHSSQI